MGKSRIRVKSTSIGYRVLPRAGYESFGSISLHEYYASQSRRFKRDALLVDAVNNETPSKLKDLLRPVMSCLTGVR